VTAGSAVGKAAVEFPLPENSAGIPALIRADKANYEWSIGEANLAEVANFERTMPRDYISDDGFGISAKGRSYLEPLIQGESHPPYVNGLPAIARLKKVTVEKKLPSFKVK